MKFIVNTLILLVVGVLWLLFVAAVVNPFFNSFSDVPGILLFAGWFGMLWEYFKGFKKTQTQ